MPHHLRTALIALVSITSATHAADWPGWRGPDRTGISSEMGLAAQWPAAGPKLLWKAGGLGEGYSTPAVAGGLPADDRSYLERLIAARTGASEAEAKARIDAVLKQAEDAKAKAQQVADEITDDLER